MINIDINILKIYWEPVRKRELARVRNEKFGWTPCSHYTNCVGWCPTCLEYKRNLEQTVLDHGEPA